MKGETKPGINRKGRKTPKGKPFVKGDPRAGRPSMTKEQKAAAKLTKTEVKYIKSPAQELKKLSMDKSLPAIDLWVIRIILLGISGGDTRRLDFMFDRLIGKVKDQIEIDMPKPTIIQTRDGNQIQLGHGEQKVIDAEASDVDDDSKKSEPE